MEATQDGLQECPLRLNMCKSCIRLNDGSHVNKMLMLTCARPKRRPRESLVAPELPINSIRAVQLHNRIVRTPELQLSRGAHYPKCR
jgi:hypothetical protein